MEADPKDSAVTKRVKKDFNELSNGEFFNKYKCSKDVYEKRVKKYGDPYMNAPLAKIGKALSKRNAAKKKIDLNKQGRLDSQSEEIIKETIKSMPKDQRKAYDKVMKTTSSRERDEYWKDALKENGWDAKVIPDVSKSDDRMMDKAIKSGPKETRDAYNAMSKDEQAEYRAKLIRQYYKSEGADLDYYGKAKPNLNRQGKLHPQKEPTTAKQELKSGLKRTGASVAMALASSATGLAAAGASNPKVKVGMLAASNILNLGSKVTTLTAGYHYVKAGAKVIKGSDTDLNSQGKQKKNKSK